MVAYSFKERFALPIETGRKRQTIRADRKRHARPSEELQLYTGMRTRNCRLVGRATCLHVAPIALLLDADEVRLTSVNIVNAGGLDAFARDDGFDDWSALKQFWAEQHPGQSHFNGVFIAWGDLRNG